MSGITLRHVWRHVGMLPSSTPVPVNRIFLSDSLEKYIFGLGKDTECISCLQVSP